MVDMFIFIFILGKVDMFMEVTFSILHYYYVEILFREIIPNSARQLARMCNFLL
jgi:hypothetical protein